MVRIFCDFDGTITPADVGNRLFRTYAPGQAEDIVEDYRTGRINARECLQRECAAAGSLTREMIEAFADQWPVDPFVHEFFAFCRARNMPVTVLSDGLDCYVNHILRREGLEDIPAFANRAVFHPDGGVAPEFPYRDEHCDHCGNCKRNHLVTMSGDDDVVVYIGDGLSDRCPVRYADVVFAKGSLIAHCQAENISYFEFRTFADVRLRMEQLLGRRIKQRREAAVARRDVFIAE